MANVDNPKLTSKTAQAAPRSSKRARLDKLLEHARKITSSSLKPDYEYATELLTQCVLEEPGNIEYVKAFIENLQKQYNNNLSGVFMAKFKEHAARNAIKKALTDGAWDEIIKQGIKVLKVNPWDAPTLMAMATAAKNMGHPENELYYLKIALMGSPKDPAVNRQCALALGERLKYDQAIAYWHRVEEAFPNDEEPKRAITFLQSQKMRGQTGFSADTITDKLLAETFIGKTQSKKQQLTAEELLLQKIDAEPLYIAPYLELSQYYIDKKQFDKAEEILFKAYEISQGDRDVEEKLDDAKLRNFRNIIIQTNDPVRKNKLQQEYFYKELDFFKKRCERYPNNLFFRYDLGYRYMLTKQYHEAIRELQLSKTDPRRKGLSLLALGKCFQQIKQYRLALTHYEAAIEEISERDLLNKREALRLAGKLALSLGALDTAEKYLSALATKDFSYKDVAVLLDKLAQERKKQFAENESANGDINGKDNLS